MATTSRVKSWVSGDTLTAADLNAEFNNVLNGGVNSITDANVASGAAISYSKLNLTGNIVNGDISNSAAIAVSKINTGISGNIVGTTDTQTVTNKRITRRVVTVTQSATPTINTDNTDVAYITGLAQAITSFTTNLSGTPVNGDSLIISITDNGTARGLTFGSSFESSGNVTLPTTTVLGVRLDIGFLWNVATSKWRCVASS